MHFFTNNVFFWYNKKFKDQRIFFRPFSLTCLSCHNSIFLFKTYLRIELDCILCYEKKNHLIILCLAVKNVKLFVQRNILFPRKKGKAVSIIIKYYKRLIYEHEKYSWNGVEHCFSPTYRSFKKLSYSYIQNPKALFLCNGQTLRHFTTRVQLIFCR